MKKVIALILVLVIGGGVIMKLLSNVTLSTPKLEVKSVQKEKLSDGSVAVIDTVLKISKVTGATKYEIYIDEEYRGYTIDTEFSLKEIIGIGGGDFKVMVRAVRELSNGDSITSDYSKSVVATVQAG